MLRTCRLWKYGMHRLIFGSALRLRKALGLQPTMAEEVGSGGLRSINVRGRETGAQRRGDEQALCPKAIFDLYLFVVAPIVKLFG